MINGFEKFAGFKVLEFFLFNSTGSFNINEVAKKAKVSVFPAKNYCDSFLKENLLIIENVGNQRRFSLNNLNPYVKELKKTFSLIKLRDLGIEKIIDKEKAYSIAIYGSFANGEYTKHSDLDILVIGERSDVNFRQVTEIEKALNIEIQLTIYNWVKWRKMEKEKNSFVEEVQKKHILLWGTNL
jgi:predicted nucleotidyltransferase